MGFKNRFREELKEDRAREHWESFELDLSPGAVAAREHKASKRGRTRHDLEEDMFQEWYTYKKLTGFANFHPWA